MDIFISHIPNTYNYGSAMMAINIIHYLKEKLGDVTFYTDCNTKEDLERLKKSTNLYNIKVTDLKIHHSDKTYKNKLSKIISTPSRIIDHNKRVDEYVDKISKNFDAIIVLGGDDLSEYYSTRGIVFELNRIRKLSLKTNVILSGQTIGPFTSYRKAVAKKALKYARIYTRDTRTFKYVTQEVGNKNAVESADLAFLDLPNQFKSFDFLLNKYNLEKEKYITIVASGLVRSYVNDREIYISAWLSMLEKILKEPSMEERSIFLLPHVLRPEKDDDRLVIKEVVKRLPENLKSKVKYTLDEMLPEEARYILGNGVFTITGRMHSAVSTFQTKKPAISLSYSIKYGGVIGEILDLNELIIESASDEKWKNKEIEKMLIEKIRYVNDNYQSLIKKIDNNVENAKKMVESQIDDIAKFIKNN